MSQRVEIRYVRTSTAVTEEVGLASNPGLPCSFFFFCRRGSDFFHGCEKKLSGKPGFDAKVGQG